VSAWLDDGELRIGLGCMRLSTDEDRNEARARETIAAALAAGIRVFDTARAYGRGEHELGHNERLLAAALRTAGVTARIVTKGGMHRPDRRWVPDGRARTIRSDCEASLDALAGLPIDLYLLHAPDPRTPWRTSLRALAALADEGLVRRVGVSNVNRRQLDEAVELAPVAAVQVGLSVLDVRSLRGGIVERCAELGLALIAHSPLGGPRRVRTVVRDGALTEIGAKHDVSAAQVALAWLLELSPVVVAIPGARRPETARSAAAAAVLRLDEDERATIGRAFDASPAVAEAAPAVRAGEVVVIMGIPGAGKSRVAAEYVRRGYVRLNRDERGGSLRELARALDEELASGTRTVVLDNTYLSRASRSYAIEAAASRGWPARCIWLDTPLAEAQVNLVSRLLERLGALPTPEQLRQLAREEEGVLAPTSQMRALRELEPPSLDEGFASVERVPFERVRAGGASGGVFVAARAVERPAWREALAAGNPHAPHLVFDWDPSGSGKRLAFASARVRSAVTGPVETALCPHPGGPPTCWCRPPLPGLPLAFARAHGLASSRSVVIGDGAAHRTLANALGATYVEPALSPSRQ
jgi:aryl-alcohol dehydrogenase-like predicted oxidoreductase/predicted kinase